MLHKDEFLSTHPDVHTGMDAFSVDGEKLGEVEMLDEDSMTIEKGWFFPRDFTVRYDDVVDVREDQVIISRSRADLEGWRSDEYSGWSEYDRMEAEGTRGKEETRIPIREEELDAEKRRREGDVRLRKKVHTETQHMKVPVEQQDVSGKVRKEDVEVERNEPKRKSR